MSFTSTDTLFERPSPLSDSFKFISQLITGDSDSDQDMLTPVSNKELTMFPKFTSERKAFSLPRSRRPSISDNSYLVSQVGDVVPIQFYRHQLYVSIDSSLTQKHTRYALTVRQLQITGLEQNRSTIFKRYSEFKRLYMVLLKTCPEELVDCPDFPASTPFKRFDPTVIQTRVSQLDTFMKFLVLHPKLVQLPIVRQFLNLNV